MTKPTSTYRMSSLTKMSLTLGKFKDAHQRGRWKRAMVDAEVSGQQVKTSKERKAG